MILKDLLIKKIYVAKNGDLHISFKCKPIDYTVEQEKELRQHWSTDQALDLVIEPADCVTPPL